MSKWFELGVSGVVLAAACGSPTSSRVTQGTTSDATWAARRGSFTLEAPVVGVGLAGDPDGTRAVANFSLASGFRAFEPGAAAWLSRVALAHALGVELAVGARQLGAVTDAELATWTARHWLSVDRPPAFRTTHAVVLVKPDASADVHAASRRLAEEIRAAVVTATTVDEFKTRANAVPASGLTVKVEDLDAVTLDGRVVRISNKPGAPAGTYDPAFAKAAAALSSVGETSAVVASAFGYHVLRLTELVPELRLGSEERRSLAAPEVYDDRARQLLGAVLGGARTPAVVAIERSAEEATSRVRVE